MVSAKKKKMKKKNYYRFNDDLQNMKVMVHLHNRGAHVAIVT